MPVSAIFDNAHFLKTISVPFLEPWVTRVTERHGRLLCLQTWVKGYMTEFGLVGLIN